MPQHISAAIFIFFWLLLALGGALRDPGPGQARDDHCEVEMQHGHG
jgi:hypothetical protein